MKLKQKSLSCIGIMLASIMMLSSCGKEAGEVNTLESDAPQQTAQTDGENQAADNQSSDENSNFNDLGTYPLVKEQETIVVFITGPSDGTYEEYWETKFLEEKTNVKIEWILQPREQFKEKLNLAFAGGEHIDLVANGNDNSTRSTPAEIIKLSQQGFILPLKDLIYDNAPNLKAKFDSEPAWEKAITTPDGEIYALPAYNEAYHVSAPNKMLINRTFLENLNIDEPTTTEDFESMLERFVNEDANGDGDPNDELGLVACATGNARMASTFLMNSFAFDDGLDRLYLNDGKVTASYMEPEFLEGLKYLNNLYNKGLIYKESFTQDQATVVKLNSQKYESIAGALPNLHFGTVGSRSADEPRRDMEYIFIAPLEGPMGTRSAVWNYYQKYETAGFIPSTCKNPELVMRWIDWAFSEEGTTITWQGAENISWEKPDEGAKGVDNNPATYKTIKMAEDNEYFGKVTWHSLLPRYYDANTRLGMQSPDNPYEPDGSGAEKIYYEATKNKYWPYAVDENVVLPPLYFSEEDISNLATLQATINTYIDESIARFITGDLNVDTDWEKFLSDVHSLGLDSYLELYQKTYDNSVFAK